MAQWTTGLTLTHETDMDEHVYQYNDNASVGSLQEVSNTSL